MEAFFVLRIIPTGIRTREGALSKNANDFAFLSASSLEHLIEQGSDSDHREIRCQSDEQCFSIA